MTITRSLLATLALASFSVAFAGDTGTHPMPANSAEALCAMSKVINESKAPAAMPIDSWYLQTSDDLSARAQPSVACNETPGCMDRAKEETKASAALSVDSWYLETADDLSAKARQPMTCKESQGHMNHAKNDIKADAATRDSWYLQTADDIRAADNQPMSCNVAKSCMTDAN